MHSPYQHVTAAVVALAAFVLALDQGGYATGFIAAAGFALWWAVLLALALRLLPRERPPAAALAAGACLALLAAWTAASLLWAGDDGAAFVEVVRVLSYLGLFVLVLLVSGRESARPWLAGLAIGLTAVVVLGLASRFEPSFGAGDLTGARLSYPIGYWNAFAACAAFSAVLLAWFSGHGERRLTRSLAAALLPLPALAIFLSGSRGGVGAALIGIALLLALGPRRPALTGSLALGAAGTVPVLVFANSRAALLDGISGSAAASEGHQLLVVSIIACAAIGLARHRLDGLLGAVRPRRGLRPLAALAAGLALVAVVVAQHPLDRFESFKQPPRMLADGTVGSSNFTNDNGSGRYQFWGAALDAFEEQPLRGIGAGQYTSWWNQHGSISWVLRDAHSLLFETAAELGLIGLALVLAFLTIPAVAGWRRRAGPQGAAAAALLGLLAAGAFSASIDWMWELPAVFAPVVAAAALLSGPATAPLSAPRRAAAEIEHRGPALAVATCLVAWVALWCAGDLLLTETKLGESRSAAKRGELGAAAEAADDAAALQPWAAEPRLQLGLVQERAGNLVAAAVSLREATERAPDDWRVWFILGRVERRSLRPAAARVAFTEARALNPRSPVFAGGD